MTNAFTVWFIYGVITVCSMAIVWSVSGDLAGNLTVFCHTYATDLERYGSESDGKLVIKYHLKQAFLTWPPLFIVMSASCW